MASRQTEKKPPETILKGVAVSDGVAVGKLYFLKAEKKKFPEFHITVHEVDSEIDRYRSAIKSSKIDLKKLQNNLKYEGSEEAITIINTHIQMLDDPFITTEMEERIRDMMRNTEAVFHAAISEYERQFSQVDNHFFQQRLIDVKDLSRRILHHLNPTDALNVFSQFPNGIIVFSKELTPSHAAEANLGQVKAFITEIGGKTSHSGLIARAKGIPFVADIDSEAFGDPDFSDVIVDGNNGIVIMHPSEATICAYLDRIEEESQRYQSIKNQAQVPSHTLDHVPIEVLANIESSSDIPELFEYDIKGIGLLRSEFLFMQRDLHKLGEEEQFLEYQNLIRQAQGLFIQFRVFDVGGDKYLTHHTEINPALGCRSIRYLLANPTLLLTQLRALLRASGGKNIKLLLPLISDLYEINAFKEIFISVKKELNIQSYIPIGAMIEVPSSAIMIDVIAKNCDFISIGTNDLIQYTLAVDRTNPHLADIYRGCHPSIVRLLKMIHGAASEEGIMVNICGEMASNPLYTPLLIGLGYRNLSCSPRYIPIIKHMIRKISIQKAHHLVEDILSCSSFKQTYDVLEEYNLKYFSD